ncbi:MAG: ATP-dependent helicase, partial [Desulfuromusa sp.]|nr:ATP-dependent helicase [Desulfuromusa sp.]
FSLVDIPKDLSQDVLHKLKGVWVCDEQLQISPDAGSYTSATNDFSKRRKFGKSNAGVKKYGSRSQKPASKRRVPPKK